MARKKDAMTAQEAINKARNAGISFKADYHQLSQKQKSVLEDLMAKVGYRNPRTASGSKLRYFFYYLVKKSGVWKK